MKILLIMLLLGGAGKERKMLKERAGTFPRLDHPVLTGITSFFPVEFYEIGKEFEFKPYLLHPSREFLRVSENTKIFKGLSRKISFTQTYGDIIYDFRERKPKVPDVQFYSYSEITFWKEVYPELKSVRQRIKEVYRNSKGKDVQREIMRLKEEFHQKYLEKRIQVMEEVKNEELKIEAQRAYQKYMKYKEGREK